MMPKVCYYVCLLLLGLLFSCGKDGDMGPEGPAGPPGEEGLKSLLITEPLAPGNICKNGGVVIKSGVDKNKNNTLDEAEIENVQNVCNGNYDKEIIITLFTGSGYTGSIKGVHLPDFNIENYQGVDSVVLVASFYPNSTNGYVALVNFTDNTFIENGSVSPTATNYTLVRTANLFSSFPKKKINLGIEIGGGAMANNIRLLLYRK